MVLLYKKDPVSRMLFTLSRNYKVALSLYPKDKKRASFEALLDLVSLSYLTVILVMCGLTPLYQ